MIEKQLRLGNIIEVFDTIEEKSYITEITSLNYDCIQSERIGGCMSFDEYDEFGELTRFLCKLVPITEEWLLKLGFEKLTDKKEGWKQSSYSLNNGKFIVCFNDGILTVDFWNGLIIQYVHQLQNLYFALTGNELVYNAT